jgi:hypothetical protein
LQTVFRETLFCYFNLTILLNKKENKGFFALISRLIFASDEKAVFGFRVTLPDLEAVARFAACTPRAGEPGNWRKYRNIGYRIDMAG